MKKLYVFALVCAMSLFCNYDSVSATETATIDKIDAQIYSNMQIQSRITNVGHKLLNANKIDVRMIFVYSSKDSKINTEPGLTKRQIIVYDKYIQFAENDDEMAAFLAREICKTAESYTGIGHGFISSVQVKCAPKKYEILFDKRAVDFMVEAGYNPLGMITYMNKAYPQKRYDKFARTNLTSKRLANIYEYIYTKYPYFLKNNEYINSDAYQNFLLTSVDNRIKLQKKLESGSKKAADYE